jgi:undecaprenyl phosphate N,N'-diacetylbacillosamine 1-phosphate transferase
MYENLIKPSLDFTFALILLIILFPLFAVLTFVLLINFKSNPFFAQKRIGKNEKAFSMLKFKTLKEETGTDEERSTQLGAQLRKFRLDELPQLFNILKCEMSFIGPRPFLPEYLPHYDSFTKKRHLVKPGITGLAQVNGGNSLAWRKRFEQDVYYVENLSFLLDLKIIILTANSIFQEKGENIGKYVDIKN